MRESIAELPVEFDLSDLQNKTYRKPYKLAIHAIKALKNARIPTAITELKKAVTNMKLLVEGRIQALYALKETSIRAPELVSSCSSGGVISIIHFLVIGSMVCV